MGRRRDRRDRLVQRLIAAAACCSLAVGARAQMVDQGGDAGGTGGGTSGAAAAADVLPAPASSLLQSGPPQVGGLGGGSPLPTTAGSTMRDRIDSALGLQAATPAGQPAVRLVPAITLEQGWTSNLYGGLGGTQSAFTTDVMPSVSASFDTQRLQGGLFYAPNLIFYEPNRGENIVGQNLSTNLHATLLPDHLFLDISGFAGQQTISGGYGPTGTVAQTNSNTSQDYSFTIAPFYLQRIGNIGTAEIGGSVNESAQIVPAGTVVAPLPGLPAAVLPSQNATTTEEHVAFASGDAFGRWLSDAYASFSQSNGTGVLNGAYRNTVAYEGGYAVTRRITALATIGWDDLYYNGVPPVRIDSPLWNVGVLLTPNPDSQITLRYGRKDGVDAPYVSAYYQLTPRTRITASYYEQLSTDQEQLRNDVGSATSDMMGNTVNVATGQSLLATNNFLGIYTSVYRLTVGSITATVLFDRDTFTIGFNHQQQQALNTMQLGVPSVSGIGNYGIASWQHDLSEVVKAGVFLQYGTYQSTSAAFPTSAAVAQNSTVLAGAAQISYAISQSLGVTLSYSYTNNGGYNTQPGYSVSTVMAGVSKTF